MKRKVLCFFSLLLILLVFCTLLSPKVTEEMATLVEAKSVDGKGMYNTGIGGIAVQWNTSDVKLFSIVEGEGWESGLRIAEVSPRFYSNFGGHIQLGPGMAFRYVYTASRDPVAGDAVRAVKVTYGDDKYLLWHPEHIGSLNALSNAMELLAQGENVALISTWNGAQPYFEHNMWYNFKDTIGKDVRIYSLNDVEAFFGALPWIAAVFSALLCSLILWGGTCILTRKEDCKKWMWMGNVLLICVLLGAVPLLCAFFDMPASLMPPEFILDIPHYVGEFQRITQSMASMGDYTVQTWLNQAATASILVAGLSALLTAGMLVAENILCRRNKE